MVYTIKNTISAQENYTEAQEYYATTVDVTTMTQEQESEMLGVYAKCNLLMIQEASKIKAFNVAKEEDNISVEEQVATLRAEYQTKWANTDGKLTIPQ